MAQCVFDQVAQPSQSGSQLFEKVPHENCKVHFTVIRDIRKMDFAKKLKPKSQQDVIQTEELRRSSSLWDESGPPGLPAETRQSV